jgi:uncharacterized protein YqgC (DUF456 family)
VIVNVGLINLWGIVLQCFLKSPDTLLVLAMEVLGEAEMIKEFCIKFINFQASFKIGNGLLIMVLFSVVEGTMQQVLSILWVLLNCFIKVFH